MLTVRSQIGTYGTVAGQRGMSATEEAATLDIAAVCVAALQSNALVHQVYIW